ncbi:hypothetical protein LXA43DRAFT_1068981 [Ganoderma leucocontextum]|nr:hypothetical protein LXA43DRAFT_1068981 [Ganoderma leucocontextum]
MAEWDAAETYQEATAQSATRARQGEKRRSTKYFIPETTPAGTGEDLVRSDQLDDLEVKKILEIRKHGRKRKRATEKARTRGDERWVYQFIFKCQDYVRSTEVQGQGASQDDEKTRKFGGQMGSIQDAAAIVDYSACEASAPPTVPGQYWTRPDVKFTNVAQEGEAVKWKVLDEPTRYCMASCRYEGTYVGRKHTLRFCSDDGCQEWYHVECLGKGTRGGAIDWTKAGRDKQCQRVQGWQPEDDDEVGIAWSRVARFPVERAPRQKWRAADPPYRGEAFSMEAVLVRLRSELEIEVKHGRGATHLGSLYPRIEDMVRGYHEQPDVSERLAREVHTATQQGAALKYYACPRCLKWI